MNVHEKLHAFRSAVDRYELAEKALSSALGEMTAAAAALGVPAFTPDQQQALDHILTNLGLGLRAHVDAVVVPAAKAQARENA